MRCRVVLVVIQLRCGAGMQACGIAWATALGRPAQAFRMLTGD